MKQLTHHAALRAIGGSMDTLRSTKATEYWTLPASLEDKPDFYEMRETIPYANLLSGFRYAGFIVYLDKPRFTDALIEAAPELLEALQLALSGEIPSDDWVVMAKDAIAKARGEA